MALSLSAEDAVAAVQADTHGRNLPLERRIDAFDGDDVVMALVGELVEQSLVCADASYVERNLLRFTAQGVVAQLFVVIAACEPTVTDGGAVVLQSVALPTRRPSEEPPRCVIDATCRLEIRSKEPPVITSSPPSTPGRKSKRLMVTTSLVASSLLSSSATSLMASSSRAAFAKAASPKPPTKTPSGHIPGVPYSTAPPLAVSTESPRKSVAFLKTAMRLASAPAHRPPPLPGADDSSVDDAERSIDGDSSDAYELSSRTPPRRTSSSLPLSPTATLLSSTAWSITLPGDPSTRDDTAAALPATTVDVEFLLPAKLPVVARRQSSMATPSDVRRTSRDVSAVPSLDRLQRRATFLQLSDEHDAVAIDPAGMLGFEMREHLALSPGVKLQSEGGEMVKSGPLLPDMPSRMRRSTFIGESLAAAATMTATVSPTRPPVRPSTTMAISEGTPTYGDDALSSRHTSHETSNNHDHSGVFSLTACASTALKRSHTHGHNESTRSLTVSHAGSVASSATTATSVKSNLFRKPSKVVRPCTAASQCCGGHGGNVCADSGAFTDLVKQRAFQRKPSVRTTSPPKKTHSRRSVSAAASSSSTSGAASPLSRRHLLSKPPSLSTKRPSHSPSHTDLRDATSLL